MEQLYEQFEKWINQNTLLTIRISLMKYGPKTIYGRMIQFEQKEKRILIYNDDTKTLESVMLNEIDDIEPSKYKD